MNSDSLVSCIVPVYNGERFLGEALDSILNQTHEHLEVIVIDDGSTDSTPDVASARSDRVRYIRQDRAGPEAARNHGVRVAGGDWIAFLDADDLWHREKLERQLAAFRAQPGLGLCHTGARNFKETLPAGILTDAPSTENGLPGVVSCCLLARREVYERVGDYEIDWTHAADMQWILRADEAGFERILLPEVLMFRRIHDGNWSLQNVERSREMHLKLIKYKLNRAREKEAPGNEPQEP